MQIKQIMPAHSWYVVRRDLESPGLSASERVWSYPLCAFALVEDSGAGETRIEAIEVLENEISLAGADKGGGTPPAA